MSAPTATRSDADGPVVASNSAANEYLVTWTGDGLAANDENEIFGQRVSAGAAEVGTDFRISTVGTDGDPAAAPTPRRSRTARRRTSTWSAGKVTGSRTNEEYEVFGQRVSAAGD